MDSGWAVVIGAIVAFAGAAVGGVFGPMLSAKRDADKEAQRLAREDERERKAALGVAITDLLGTHLDRIRSDPSDTKRITELETRSAMALLALGLLLDDADQPIVSIVTSANRKLIDWDEDAPQALAALTSVLPAWRRGTLSGWAALDAYRSQSGDPVPIENEVQFRTDAAGATRRR